MHHPRYASEIRIPAAAHSNVYIDHILCLRILLPDFWFNLTVSFPPKPPENSSPPSFEEEKSWWFVKHRFCWLSFSPFRSQTLLMIEGGFLSLRPKLLPCPRLQLHYENFFAKSIQGKQASFWCHCNLHCLINLFSFPPPLPAECVLVSSVTAFGTNPEKGK